MEFYNEFAFSRLSSRLLGAILVREPAMRLNTRLGLRGRTWGSDQSRPLTVSRADSLHEMRYYQSTPSQPLGPSTYLPLSHESLGRARTEPHGCVTKCRIHFQLLGVLSRIKVGMTVISSYWGFKSHRNYVKFYSLERKVFAGRSSMAVFHVLQVLPRPSTRPTQQLLPHPSGTSASAFCGLN